jgi:hypothetical protein
MCTLHFGTRAHTHYTVHITQGVQLQEVKYIESWHNTTSSWAGWSRLIFQWIGMVEHISC